MKARPTNRRCTWPRRVQRLARRRTRCRLPAASVCLLVTLWGLPGTALAKDATARNPVQAPTATTAAPTVSVPAGLPPALGIRPFQMRYHVLRDGWHLGNAVFTLERKNGVWHFQSRAKASGLASLFVHATFSESSRFEVRDGILHPLEYSYIDSGNAGHDEHISFDWNEHTVTDTKGKKTKTFPLVPGMLDRLTAQLELSRELAAGVPLAHSFVVINGSEIKQFHMKRLHTDEIATPAGNFKTLLVAREDPKSKRTTRFWLATRHEYLPVKIQQREPGKATVTFVLAKLQWLKQGPDPERSAAESSH